MSMWWYSLEEKKLGPVAEDELQRLLASDRITANTLVWSEGMQEWLALRDAAQLAHLVRALPPELPASTASESVLALADAGPWRRFFARLVDFLVLGFATGYAVALVLSSVNPAFAYWIAKPGSEYVFGWLVTPLVLLVEAAVFSIIGTTLGKGLLGVRVVTIHGVRPTWRQYLRRLWGVYWYGLAIGFPLINLFAMARQRGHLLEGRQTTYDQGVFLVKAPKLKLLRALLATLVVFGLLVAQGLLTSVQRQSSSGYIGGFSWTNPETGIKVAIPSGWVKEASSNEQGQAVDLFSSPDAGVTLIFASEEMSQNLSIDYYAAIWAKVVAKDMNVDFPNRAVVVDGKPTMRGYGAMVEDARRSVDVVIVRRGDRVWRVVAVGLPGRSVSSEQVDLVRARLLQSLGPAGNL